MYPSDVFGKWCQFLWFSIFRHLIFVVTSTRFSSGTFQIITLSIKLLKNWKIVSIIKPCFHYLKLFDNLPYGKMFSSKWMSCENQQPEMNINMDLVCLQLFLLIRFYSYSLLPVSSKYERWRNGKDFLSSYINKSRL